MPELFTDLPTNWGSVTIPSSWANDVDTAANLLKRRTDHSLSRIWNIESPPYNATPDVYLMDGSSTVTGSSIAITGTAATDVITATGHTYKEGTAVTLSGLTGGAGLANGVYYVRNPGAGTFQVAATYGGAVVNFTTDITAGSVIGASTYFSSSTAAFAQTDVGAHIVILGSGDSGSQDRHSTITTVINATTVVMANTTGVTRTSAKFYFTRGATSAARATANTTAIQTAIDDCSAAGGGIVFCPSVGYVVNSIVLKSRVHLMGTGWRSTMLHLAHNVNAPVIYMDVTPGDSARWTILEGLWINGNRKNQSNITTTLAAAYTAGNTSVTLTSAAGWLPKSGSFSIGSNRFLYANRQGNVLYGVGGGLEGTTDVSAAIGATVTHYAASGVVYATNPHSSDALGTGEVANFGETDDAVQTMRNCYVYDCKAWGVEVYGMGDNHIVDSEIMQAYEGGLRTGWDFYGHNLNIGKHGRMGVHARSSGVHFSNVTSWLNGLDGPTEGYGWMVEGPFTIEEGSKSFVNCQAQDNQAEGWYIKNAQRVSMAACATSGNSRRGVGLDAGIRVEGGTNSFIDIMAVERGFGGSYWQQNAIEVVQGATESTNMQIRVTTSPADYSVGSPPANSYGLPLKPGSVLTSGVNLVINGQGSTVLPAYSATYQPDPYRASKHHMTLTGPLSILDPWFLIPGVTTGGVVGAGHLGTELEFLLVQDATGGRTITFPTSLPAVWAPSLAPGAASRIVFRHNGTGWIQTDPSGDTPLAKRVTADVTNSTTTVAALTDLDFTVAANTDYTVDYRIMYSSAATTTGLGLQVGVSGSTPVTMAGDIAITGIANTDAAGVATTGISGNTFYGLITVNDDLVLSTGVVAASTVYPAFVRLTFRTGATGGTLSIKQRSEVAASAITIKRGSHAILYVG